MNKEGDTRESTEKSHRQPYWVRLPGFVTDKEIGLGDAIKRVTYANHAIISVTLVDS